MNADEEAANAALNAMGAQSWADVDESDARIALAVARIIIGGKA